MNNINIKEPVTKKEFEQYYNLRWRILRKPWNQPFGSERDYKENQSIHIIACIDEKIVGVGRGHFNSQTQTSLNQWLLKKQIANNIITFLPHPSPLLRGEGDNGVPLLLVGEGVRG